MILHWLKLFFLILLHLLNTVTAEFSIQRLYLYLYLKILITFFSIAQEHAMTNFDSKQTVGSFSN